MKKNKLITQLSTFIIIYVVLPQNAYAASNGIYAWEDILNKVVDSLTGPVAYAISIMAIVISGFVIAFADMQGGAKRFVQAACGLSVALFASQIVTGFLGFSGAVI